MFLFHLIKLFCLALIFTGLSHSPAFAQNRTAKTWNIAYIEGGAFLDYQKILRGIALGLQRYGLIENGNVPVPANTEETTPLWFWLAENAGGTTLKFLENAHYSAHWDIEKRKEIAKEIHKRIQEKNDIDLIIASGTWAGQDMRELNINVPVVVISVTNALEAHIIDSVTDSGKDNLTAAIEPNRFQHQVTLFHNIFNFKKLGIAYEDTPSGKSSIALREIEKAAEELDFGLIRCTGTFDIADTHLASERLKLCHEKLAEQGADAVYLTLNIGLQPENTAEILEPLIKAHIPTFSQAGQNDVEHGALLSLSQLNIEEEGAFSAKQINEIVKGAKPRDLNQIFESIVSFAINLRTATLIGWNPSLELLIAIDEFYQEIK